MDIERSEGPAMSAMNVEAKLPPDILEARAAEQRRRIHATVLQLREQVEEKLDVRRHASEYVWPGMGVAALFGLVFGWGLTGMFSSPRR
jgi:hypothetical protein